MVNDGVTARMTRLAEQARWGAYDFAYWFDKPRATVRNWYLGNFEPRGFQRKEILNALDLLETALNKGLLRQLDGISAHERPERIRWLRACADSNYIPRPRSAKNRVPDRLRRQR